MSNLNVVVGQEVAILRSHSFGPVRARFAKVKKVTHNGKRITLEDDSTWNDRGYLIGEKYSKDWLSDDVATARIGNKNIERQRRINEIFHRVRDEVVTTRPYFDEDVNKGRAALLREAANEIDAILAEKVE